MPLTPGFPTSLTEYVEVWCADLLTILTAEQRHNLLNGIAMMYEGGPWPSRLDIQRLAEQRSGLYGDADVFIGDIVGRMAGGVTGTISRLHLQDDAMGVAALDQLHQLPGSPELVRAVEAEVAEGTLTPAERDTILRSPLSHAVLPDPIEAPAEYPPIPSDHPESYEEKLRRDPPYEAFEPDPKQRDELADLDRKYEAGLIDRQAYRTAISEIVRARVEKMNAPV